MDEKVYTQEVIPDTPFPSQTGAVSFDTSQPSANQTYKPTTIQEQGFPTLQVAQELLSDSLNTRTKKILNSFDFTPSGAIQIGNYQSGITGDVKISPAGIVARNSLGDTTFGLDGETGDAIFAGEVRSGSTITGDVTILNNGHIILYNGEGIPSIFIGEL